MNPKPKLREAVAVEGRYDAHAVRAAVDTLVIELGGFSVFHNEKKRQMLRQIAEERGLILLTDSDGAGLLIRTRLRALLGSRNVRFAYVPAIPGKERRKQKPGAAGLLGVEAMSAERIRAALAAAGAVFLTEPDEPDEAAEPDEPVTRGDLYDAGFFGRTGSAAKRAALLKAMELPPDISVNALVEMLEMKRYRASYRRFLADAGEETNRQHTNEKEPAE